MAPKRPTVHDVARESGVSIATVSRVLHGGHAAPQTRARVHAAIAALGYAPSHLGRALVGGKHDALGIVFPGLGGPYFSEVIQGFEAEAVAGGQSVLVLGTHLRPGAPDLVRELSGRVDGLALMAGTVPAELMRKLVAAGFPLVLLAGKPQAGVPAVRVDNEGAMHELTRHLIVDHGHRTLTFVGDPNAGPDASQRWRGFRSAHRAAGLPAPAQPVKVAFEQADGVVAGRVLLDRPTLPGAVVCVNDETALGVLLTLQTAGVRVPFDVAVTGFDGTAMSGLVAPGITTVRQPTRELGAETARLLAARIARDRVPRDTVLPTELVRRGSCGCTPRLDDTSQNFPTAEHDAVTPRGSRR